VSDPALPGAYAAYSAAGRMRTAHQNHKPGPPWIMSWSVHDGARDEDGYSGVLVAESGGAYGMRGDGAGVGNMGTTEAWR
jgi:hypothetical protein